MSKTAISLSALESRHLPALVVAPKRVAEHVWPVEKELWRPDLTLALVAGSPQQRAHALAQRADITVISRDNMGDAAKIAKRMGYRTVIFDELSSFKSPSSQRFRAARSLSKKIEHVWGLTGTPTPNGLTDLYAEIMLLDGGKRLGTNQDGFRYRWFKPGKRDSNGRVVQWVPRDEAQDNIHRLIEDICLSISGDGLIELPDVTHNRVSVQLPPRSMAQYREMKDNLVLNIDLLGEDLAFSAENSAVLSGKLSQISAGFIYSDDVDLDGRYTVLHKAKTDALREIVDGTGSPILVFYRFRAELEMLLDAFPQASTINSADAIPRWNRGQIPLMFAHPASAGHGLNLQHGGCTIAWTTLTWSLEEWMQGNGRIARQGQKHPVIIHSLLADGTIDTYIREVLDNKREVQDALLDHVRSPL